MLNMCIRRQTHNVGSSLGYTKLCSLTRMQKYGTGTLTDHARPLQRRRVLSQPRTRSNLVPGDPPRCLQAYLCVCVCVWSCVCVQA